MYVHLLGLYRISLRGFLISIIWYSFAVDKVVIKESYYYYRCRREELFFQYERATCKSPRDHQQSCHQAMCSGVAQSSTTAGKALPIKKDHRQISCSLRQWATNSIISHFQAEYTDLKSLKISMRIYLAIPILNGTSVKVLPLDVFFSNHPMEVTSVTAPFIICYCY